MNWCSMIFNDIQWYYWIFIDIQRYSMTCIDIYQYSLSMIHWSLSISGIFEHNLNSKPNVCLRLRAAWSDSHLPASPRSKRHFLLVMSMSQQAEYILQTVWGWVFCPLFCSSSSKHTVVSCLRFYALPLASCKNQPRTALHWLEAKAVWAASGGGGGPNAQ